MRQHLVCSQCRPRVAYCLVISYKISDIEDIGSSKTIFRELSSAAKDAILEKHNELRRRVAKGEETGGINPPQQAASNMKKLVRTGHCKTNTSATFPVSGLELGAGGRSSEVGGSVHLWSRL